MLNGDTRFLRAKELGRQMGDELEALSGEVVNDNLEASRLLLKGSMQHLKILEGRCTTTT